MGVAEQPVITDPTRSGDGVAVNSAPPLPSQDLAAGPLTRIRRWLAHTGPEYKVGTLTYTRLGLFMVCLWLLWGDLVWNLMENVFPYAMPLQLDRMGVPAQWIGYMMGTAGAIINMSFVPVISFRSDRTRTRWGRRMPYIVVTMPFLCLFLVILGFSDSIGAVIKASDWPARIGISPTAALVIVMGVLILFYDVFNVFVNSIYWYLFRDVVPSAFLGRFMAAFRMVGTAASMIWNAFLFGRIETHTTQLYVGVAILYFFGFGLMCLMVKEGHYSPPDDLPPKTEPWYVRLWESIELYVRQSFTHPMFLVFYLSQALFAVGMAATMYKNLFYIRHLHFTPGDIGKFLAFMGPIILALQYPIGWLADKIHPMRTYLIGATLIVPVYLSGFFIDNYSVAGYAINAFGMYMGMMVLQMPLSALGEGSQVPLAMRLYPAKQYGQFSSAAAMLRHFSMIFGTIAGATFMGVMNRKHGQAGNGYIFLWHGGFQAAGALCLWIVYWYWRRCGAEKFKFDPEEEDYPGASGKTKTA